MKRLRGIALALTAAIVVMSLFAVYTVLDDVTDESKDLQQQVETSDADRADLRAELEEQRDKTALLADQVASLGKTPVVTPSSPPADARRYVPVPGEKGDRGPAGRSVTFIEVLRAVGQMIDDALARSCGGSCVGPKGDTGEKGEKGATGEPGVGMTGESHCDAQGRFVFGLTDGSEAVVDGSRCRQAGVLPE